MNKEKKPSERIFELFDKNHNKINDTEASRLSDMISSVITYLDEEFDKNLK